MSTTPLPIVIGPAGAIAQNPVDIRTQLVELVTAINPGYTANLPGSLIEDIASTDVAAIALCDNARVDLINSLTPYGANVPLLIQLGTQAGVMQGENTNTNVYVVFTGPAGYTIPVGFVVSDGTHQYTVQDGGIIGAGSTSLPLYCVATQAGVWAVPAHTVTQLITSVPSTISLTVTNPQDGIPQTQVQTEADYRAQVLQAGYAPSQGMVTYLKTLLGNIPGVQKRLVSIRPVSTTWEIIVGGGDPYQVANAIFTALFDISTLVGSTLGVTGITQANPGVVTTNLNHGFATGQIINIANVVGMTAVNNTPLTVTVLSPTTFSIGVNTSGYGAYVSGGVVTPNLRNLVTTIRDFPDTYQIPTVIPPSENVSVVVTWNTNAVNFVSGAAVAQLANPALVNYINNIYVGQPMNLFELQNVFQEAVASVLPPQLLTRMVFAVTINGVGVSPTAGTGIIAGDPESYFVTSSTAITITQG